MAISTTYEPIATYTVPSSAGSYTFTSIPQTYTDLVMIFNGVGGNNISLQFNGDTSSNYSATRIQGDGSTASSSRWSNTTSMFGPYAVAENVTIWQIQNYSNSTTYKTALAKGGGAGTQVEAYVGLWRNTAAITSLTVITPSANISAGSTISIYGIASTSNASANKASGGTITVGSGYTYHAFTAGGTFTPSEDITADILLIAGGGGGGTYSGGGGGGGAGGVLLLANQSLTSGTGYTVSVGGGGAANTSGQNSYFGALTQAVGGGYGGSASIGGNGGSGGGASDSGYAAGTGTAGQGFAGGIGTGAGSSPGGGGGGSAEPGQNAYGDSVPNIAGKGGSGTNIYYDWAAVTSTGVSGYYAGGGGGGVYINSSFANNGGGAGGNGGGGSGTASSKNATTNTGSGGGGGSYTSSPVAPGNGGSGLVIVRYAN